MREKLKKSNCGPTIFRQPYTLFKAFYSSLDQYTFGEDPGDDNEEQYSANRWRGWPKHIATTTAYCLVTIPWNSWFRLPFNLSLYDLQSEYLRAYNSTNISHEEEAQALFTSTQSITETQANMTTMVMYLYFVRLLVWFSQITTNLAVRSIRGLTYCYKNYSTKNSHETLPEDTPQQIQRTTFFNEVLKTYSTVYFAALLGLLGYFVFEGLQGFQDDIKRQVGVISSIKLLSLLPPDVWSKVSDFFSNDAVGLWASWPTLSYTPGLNIGLLPLILVGALGAYRIYRNAVFALSIIGALSLPLSVVLVSCYHCCCKRPLAASNHATDDRSVWQTVLDWCIDKRLLTTNNIAFLGSTVKLVAALFLAGSLFTMRTIISRGMALLFNDHSNPCLDPLSSFSLPLFDGILACILHQKLSAQTQIDWWNLYNSLGTGPYHPLLLETSSSLRTWGQGTAVVAMGSASSLPIMDYFSKCLAGHVSTPVMIKNMTIHSPDLCPKSVCPNGYYNHLQRFNFTEQTFYSVLSGATLSEIYYLYPILASVCIWSAQAFIVGGMGLMLYNIACYPAKKEVLNRDRSDQSLYQPLVGGGDLNLLSCGGGDMDDTQQSARLKRDSRPKLHYPTLHSGIKTLFDFTCFCAKITAKVSVLYFLFQLVANQKQLIDSKQYADSQPLFAVMNHSSNHTSNITMLSAWAGIFLQMKNTILGQGSFDSRISYLALFHVRAWTNVVWDFSYIALACFSVIGSMFCIEQARAFPAKDPDVDHECKRTLKPSIAYGPL